jgi:hypothetical protein
MKNLEDMSAEELARRMLVTDYDSPAFYELLARLRERDAAWKWIEGHKNGVPQYMLGMDDIRSAMLAARKV